MTEEVRRSRATEAFFGRRRGKTVRPNQAEALRGGLESYGLDLAGPPPADLTALFADPVAEVRLEIGFGGGEHLRHEASRHPGTGFIGVEPFVNSMAKMTAALAAVPMGNLRLFDDDATRLLDWLPDGSLAGIDLLYPDPWPKRKHWKRRFVAPANLARFHRVLRQDGIFRFASDIESYVNWTLCACARHGGFAWQARSSEDWLRPYDGWPGTRYEAKALREGRRPAYLTLRRV